jgi:hypothetical protein
MSGPLHSTQLPVDGIHVAHALEFANAGTRAAYVAVAAEVGKIALQLDTLAFYILTAAPGTWVDITAGGTPSAGSAQLLFGNGSVSSTTTTRYLTPGFENDLAGLSAQQVAVTRVGTIKHLYVRHNTPGGNGNAVVYTVRKNGAAQSVTVSLASTGTSGSDVANSFVVAAGDTLDIEVTKAASIGASPDNITAMLEFTA